MNLARAHLDQPALVALRELPPLRLAPTAGATGDLSRFTGTYAGSDRRCEVTSNDTGLVVETSEGSVEALPIDGCTFLVNAEEPDAPTVTFGAFDEGGRPGVLYEMLWGLPRLG